MNVKRFAFLLMLVPTCGVVTIGVVERSRVARADERPTRVDAFKKDVAPLLAKYCTGCHGGTDPKAELALDGYKDAVAAEKDRETWERVQEMLANAEMPPKNKPQPNEAELKRLAAWIDATLAKTDCGGAKHPGRVTIRRLNRAEYNNTIRDLIGVDFEPAEDFPTDDVGYGFDNIGDVLSMPPLLVEKYVAAAEQVVRAAIVPDAAARIPTRRLEAKDFAGGDRFGSRVVVSRNDASAEFKFTKDSRYQFRVKASVSLTGEKPPRLVVKLDDKEVFAVDVTEPRDTAKTHEFSIDVRAGERKLVLTDARRPRPEPADGQDSNKDSEKARGPLLSVEFLEVRGPADLPATHTRIITCQPTGERSSIDCARKVLRDFGSRAFRRPVADDELDRLVRLVRLAQEQGDSFERGIQLAMQAVLSSPHFLFRVELDPTPNDPEAIRPLNDFELATRLSYFLWSSLPDDELFELARKGELRQAGALDTQVLRMIKDAKAAALVENFAGQWLQLRDVAKVTPDPELFPGFDDALRAAMLRETELFFETIIREDRSVLDCLDADFTFVNERLARHYGIAGVKGDEFRRVALSGSPRRGVLTQASILTLTSNPTRTSPVKRGKWIMENILGTPPPAPPPAVPELEEGKEAMLKGSLRERMEQHRSNPNCATCHARMDPLGFAFENFDAVGAWRDFDGRFTIDASGVLPGGKKFDGPPELIAILKTARRQQFCRCFAEKMLTYALGRGLESFDRCAVDKIVEGLEKNDYRFSSLVAEIVQSDPFLWRGSKGDAR